MLHLPLFAQYALIGLAVALSLWAVVNQQMPATMRRLRLAIALRLLRSSSGWAAGLGRRIAPRATEPGACGGCTGCGASSAKQ